MNLGAVERPQNVHCFVDGEIGAQGVDLIECFDNSGGAVPAALLGGRSERNQVRIRSGSCSDDGEDVAGAVGEPATAAA